MNKFKKFLDGMKLFLYAAFCISIAGLGLWYLVLNRFDKNWKTPDRIASQFVWTAQKGQCLKAAEYWTKEGLKNLLAEESYLENFEMYCAQFRQFTQFVARPAQLGKSGYFGVWIKASNHQAGGEDSQNFHFYLKQYDRQWRVVSSSGGLLSQQYWKSRSRCPGEEKKSVENFGECSQEG